MLNEHFEFSVIIRKLKKLNYLLLSELFLNGRAMTMRLKPYKIKLMLAIWQRTLMEMLINYMVCQITSIIIIFTIYNYYVCNFRY